MNLESLSLLLILSILHPALSSPTDLYPIKDICEKTSYPDECKSTLNAMVPDLTTADPTTILQLFMKAADVSTEAALSYAKEISNEMKTNQYEKSILNACITSYESASTSLEEAENALEQHDKEKLKSYISAVITSSNDCEDAYKTGKLESPFSEYAAMNEHLAGNGLKLIESFWQAMPPLPSLSLSEMTPQSIVIEEEYSVTSDDYSESLGPSTAPSSDDDYSDDLIGPLTAPSSDDDYSDLLGPSTAPSSFIGSSDEAKSVCDKTKYPDICMSSVQSVASGPLKSNNAAAILQLLIKNTIFTTQAAIDRAKVFAKASETDQGTKDILDHKCVKEYELALNGLEEVTKAIAINDKEKIKSNLTGLISRYNKCGAALEDTRLDSPMGEYKNTLNQLAENNLAVATLF